MPAPTPPPNGRAPTYNMRLTMPRDDAKVKAFIEAQGPRMLSPAIRQLIHMWVNAKGYTSVFETLLAEAPLDYHHLVPQGSSGATGDVEALLTGGEGRRDRPQPAAAASEAVSAPDRSAGSDQRGPKARADEEQEPQGSADAAADVDEDDSDDGVAVEPGTGSTGSTAGAGGAEDYDIDALMRGD